jgi:hypothetical protein
LPHYREVHFWVRAAILWDTTRQQADADHRLQRIAAYEGRLAWVQEHLNRGRFYTDPAWVAGHLADLAQEFKDVAPFVAVTFTQENGRMALTYQRRPEQLEKAAHLDGKWVLVTNQPRLAEQSVVDYLDWMGRVYQNHRHVERRMRNLKSDLPIRPLYGHRDEAIVALCFVSVVALMLSTLIERDCQADPVLGEAGLTTTEQVLGALASWCVTVVRTPSGWEVSWPDTPTATPHLIWRQLRLPDPGRRLPVARPTRRSWPLPEDARPYRARMWDETAKCTVGVSNRVAHRHAAGVARLSVLLPSAKTDHRLGSRSHSLCSW